MFAFKKSLAAIAALALGATLCATPAEAGSTVCAGGRVYYSKVKYDFGSPPPTGILAGSSTLILDGKILDRFEYVTGTGGYHMPPYEISLAGRLPLSETGPTDYKTTAYYATLRIAKKSSAAQPLPPGSETFQEPVVCRDVTKFAP